MQLYHATYFGECISAHCYSFHIHQKSDKTGLSPHQPTRLHPTSDISMDYFQCLDVSLMHYPPSDGLILNELSLDSVECKYHNPCIPRVLAILDPSLATKLNQLYTSDIIIYPMFSSK